jgi:hypothetical protein
MQMRITAALAAIAVTLLGVAPTAAPQAQAATPNLATAPVALTTTPEPTTSPAPVSRTWVTFVGPELCSSGYLCAFVQSNDPAKRYTGWWRFKFYKCADYSLNYWHDYDGGQSSEIVDAQTGSVTTTLFGSTGNTLQTFKPHPTYIQEVLLNKGGWNPVYKIRSCPN